MGPVGTVPSWPVAPTACTSVTHPSFMLLLSKDFQLDGANLEWVSALLYRKNDGSYRAKHLRDLVRLAAKRGLRCLGEKIPCRRSRLVSWCSVCRVTPPEGVFAYRPGKSVSELGVER